MTDHVLINMERLSPNTDDSSHVKDPMGSEFDQNWQKQLNDCNQLVDGIQKNIDQLEKIISAPQTEKRQERQSEPSDQAEVLVNQTVQKITACNLHIIDLAKLIDEAMHLAPDQQNILHRLHQRLPADQATIDSVESLVAPEMMDKKLREIALSKQLKDLVHRFQSVQRTCVKRARDAVQHEGGISQKRAQFMKKKKEERDKQMSQDQKTDRMDFQDAVIDNHQTNNHPIDPDHIHSASNAPSTQTQPSASSGNQPKNPDENSQKGHKARLIRYESNLKEVNRLLVDLERRHSEHDIIQSSKSKYPSLPFKKQATWMHFNAPWSRSKKELEDDASTSSSSSHGSNTSLLLQEHGSVQKTSLENPHNTQNIIKTSVLNEPYTNPYDYRRRRAYTAILIGVLIIFLAVGIKSLVWFYG